ncbi:MAG: glycosyl hydrolase family 28 protein [Janthinobacterium lividum]
MITGLFLPAAGYWTVEGIGRGSGFYQATGSNNDSIHNGASGANIPFDPGTSAPALSAHKIALRNFTINGNRGTGANGNSTSGNPQGNNPLTAIWCGINLLNADQVEVENVNLYDIAGYALRLSNCAEVDIRNVRIEQPIGGIVNTDGIHLSGPCTNVRILGGYLTGLGDDSIAINAPEGYGGNINGTLIDGVTFNSVATMFRIYTAGTSATTCMIDRVRIANCQGTAVTFVCQMGLNANGGVVGAAHAIGSVEVDDCTFTAPYFWPCSQNIDRLSFRNTTRLAPAQANAWVYTPINACAIGLVEFVDSRIVRNGNGSANAYAVDVENGASVGCIHFDGFSLQDQPGSSYGAVPYLINCGSGTIGRVVIDALDPHGITTLFSGSGIPSGCIISGSGVLATGWTFPDANMANGTPYLSANSGLASVKVNGTVKPLTS